MHAYLNAARDANALTAVITNAAGSAMGRNAEHLLLCRAGEERAVAATKTYTAEMALLPLLGLALSAGEEMTPNLAGLPAKMAEVLSLETEIRARVDRYAFIEECTILARGINQATALETALKTQETCHIGAKGFSAADFMYGPIAIVKHRYPVLLFAPAQ